MLQSDLNYVVLKLSSLNHLKQFHAHLFQHSLHHHSHWVARLIALCARLHAPPSYTRHVLGSAHQPDALIFSNMLRYYSKFGTNEEILALFAEMRQFRVKPDDSVYPILIKAAGRSSVLFHAELIKMGLDCGKYIRNGLMNMYGKYGPIEAARQMFDEMTDRSVADWNAMTSGYWKWGREVEAKGLFDFVPNKNVITWTAMITGYSKMKDLETARKYFDMMPEKSVVSWNAMLSGYAQNGFHEETLSLFRDMLNTDDCKPDQTTWVAVISSCAALGDPGIAESVAKMIDDRGIQLNIFVKTALLDLYAKCGRIEIAQKLFDELGAYRNSVTWNSMLSAYTRIGDLSSAREIFDQMPERNLVSWNSMIAGYAQNGQSAMAVELFKKMTYTGVMPDEVTMVSVISACGHLGALELSRWVVDYITTDRINLSISGYNSLIFMYSRCGSMKDAKTIFNRMENRDVVSYNALITGLGTQGNGMEALKLLQKMKNEGIEPDRITYIGVLTACSHSGMLEEGREIFESIEAPDIDHYACLVDLLGRVGKLDEATRIVEEMYVVPHAGIYGSLLHACRVHKRLDLGEIAANKLFELEPENSGNYILLSNMYASVGKWKEVDRIRGLMKARGVMKTIGWSWVEYNRTVHKFSVGDRSHEQSAEIYRVLGELKRKMRDAGYEADRSNVLRDVEDEEKEEMVGIHSEKLAVAFCLVVSEPGSVIRVMKNLRICLDCHTAMKIISKLEGREIIVRDNNRFHCFKDNACSCNDYW